MIVEIRPIKCSRNGKSITTNSRKQKPIFNEYQQSLDNTRARGQKMCVPHGTRFGWVLNGRGQPTGPFSCHGQPKRRRSAFFPFASPLALSLSHTLFQGLPAQTGLTFLQVCRSAASIADQRALNRFGELFLTRRSIKLQLLARHANSVFQFQAVHRARSALLDRRSSFVAPAAYLQGLNLTAKLFVEFANRFAVVTH